MYPGVTCFASSRGSVPVRHRLLLVLSVLACPAGLAAPAHASQLIARNASLISLAVNSHGTALITYRDRGRWLHLLARGAVNARVRPPRPGVPQVKFRLDYTGGRASLHRPVWRHFGNGCLPYDGPQLDWFVTGCKAPDGSYWALQSWQTALPGLGFAPWLFRQKQWWLHLSHWTGPPARLDVYQDWVYSRHWEEVFGQLTYRGVGVRGFGTTHFGAPTDNYGRLLYLDTHNSKYGPGWRREEAFVSSGPPGLFCFGFFPRDPYVNGHPHPPGTPHRRRGPAHGDQYRITAVGPGVTPDVTWHGPGLHAYNAGNPDDVALEQAMNAKLDEIRAGWRKCRHH
jgi:hypothetical protein